MKTAAAPLAAPACGTGVLPLVQTVVCPRARGLSVRLNLTPDGACNFDCVYCDVRRNPAPGGPMRPDVGRMMDGLAAALEVIRAGRAREELPGLAGAPEEYLRLGQVALSGTGEPTLCPIFEEVVHAVLHLRAGGRFGFFKLALVTNSSNLHDPQVRRSLRLFTPQDEIWAKLDAGSADWYRQVNRPQVPYEVVLDGITGLGRERPLVIQSLIPRLSGRGMPVREQEAYVQRLAQLRQAGARIDFVQVYSAHRPPVLRTCTHAALSELSALARRVRDLAGIPAGVF
ncbi:MAG: hypothetical protein ACKOET_03270 [Verrucomicrobiota bacterium]